MSIKVLDSKFSILLQEIDMAQWVEANVDNASEHFHIKYGDIETSSPKEWLNVARVAFSKQNLFIVEFTIEPINQDNKKILESVKKELDFYIVEKNEPNVYNYLLYHCSTSANIYSMVHWSYVKVT